MVSAGTQALRSNHGSPLTGAEIAPLGLNQHGNDCISRHPSLLWILHWHKGNGQEVFFHE